VDHSIVNDQQQQHKMHAMCAHCLKVCYNMHTLHTLGGRIVLGVHHKPKTGGGRGGGHARNA